jgi:DnaJ-class molecular chaperone
MKPTPNNYLKCPFFTSWYDYCGDGDELEPKDSGKCDFMEDEQCSDTENPCVCDICKGEGWLPWDKIDDSLECDYLSNSEYICNNCNGKGIISDKEVEE